ncbi:hypothetical protein DFH09DRAFT_1334481 [Mycena vulgaris]|nr:hypothetical protein DFH09DRAFT_1334481 [Mycena vulgaris]
MGDDFGFLTALTTSPNLLPNFRTLTIREFFPDQYEYEDLIRVLTARVAGPSQLQSFRLLWSKFWNVKARSPTLFTEAPIDCILDRTEQRKHRQFFVGDLMRHKTLYAAAQIAPATGPPYPDPESDQVGVIVPTPQEPTANSTDVPPAEHNVTRDDPTDLEDLTSVMGVPQPGSVDLKIAGDIDDGVNSLENMLINFSHDLSTVTELNNPAEYFKEVEAIARFE